MRILHIMPTLDRSYGGPVNTVLNLAKAQREINESVSIWATASKTADDAHLNACRDLDIKLFKRNLPKKWYRSSHLVKSLRQQISSFDLVEIHGIWEYTSFASASIAHQANLPYVLRPTGIFTHPWRYRTLKKRIYSATIGRNLLNAASCIHTASKIEADGCIQAGIHVPITIVPNGVDPSVFSDTIDENAAEKRWPILRGNKVILFLSRISKEKGLDQYIPAIKKTLKHFPNEKLLFVIAGPNHKGYLPEVEALVKKCGIRSNVFFLSMVHGNDKLALFRRADLFVLPSYSENYGIVIAEALASGIPVVTTTGTPWKVLMDIDAGRWVPPTSEALANALIDLLTMSKEDRRSMGQRGRKLILQKYTWAIVAGKLQTVYDRILSNKDIPLQPGVF